MIDNSNLSLHIDWFFTCSKSDASAFIKAMLFFLLLVYVDDIIEIISNRIAMIEVKRYYLNKRIRQGTEETTVN